MSVAGDRLEISNRNGAMPAAQINQAPDSIYPALAVGGNVTITGIVSSNGVTPVGAPLVGQVEAATSTKATAWSSAVNAGPWVFDVRAFGALGDGQVATDGAITSATKALACTTSKPFTAADVGKAVMIRGAGATGVTTHVTTITAFTDSGHVTVASNAGTTVSGALVMWATDDTAAVQAAINAAVTYAQGASGHAKVFIPPAPGRFYGIAGPLVNGGATLGNGQLTLPIITTTVNKVTLEIEGVGVGAATRHWQQIVPPMNASCLVSFGVFASSGAQGASLDANGMAAMLTGPSGARGYGTSAALFNNMSVVIRHLSVLTAHSVNGLGYGAFSFHGMACASIFDVSVGTIGTVPNGDFNTPQTFANGYSVGIVMPASGNNDNCPIRNLAIQGGYVRGIYLTEHCDWQGGMVLYCWSGICPVGTYGDGGAAPGAFHAANWSQVSVEGCTYLVEVIGPGASGIGPQLHGVIDNEGVPKFHDSTSGTGLASALGEIRLVGGGGTVSTDTPTALRIIDETVAPGPAAALAPSAVATPKQNTYWRWATVFLAGGTVTGIKIAALMGGASAPTMTSIYTQSSGALPLITIRVPPGGWYEIDGTVLPTTNSWVLE